VLGSNTLDGLEAGWSNTKHMHLMTPGSLLQQVVITLKRSSLRWIRKVMSEPQNSHVGFLSIGVLE
jgi:hypothetical protein